MEASLAKLKTRFPTLPQDVLRKVYKCRLERLKVLTRLGVPENVRWFIEAKVRLSGEFPDSFIKKLPGLGKSSYSRKRRAKRMGVCFKCARWNCDTRCRNHGYLSVNREDKIRCLKDGLSKESLEDIRKTLETHPSGDSHHLLLNLWKLYRKEKERYNLGDTTVTDPVCQFVRELDEKQVHRS